MACAKWWWGSDLTSRLSWTCVLRKNLRTYAINYYFKVKADTAHINPHQFIWTIQEHCCILPACSFPFTHKSLFTMWKHTGTHCKCTLTPDVALWDHLGAMQVKFNLMGQLMTSISLFSDSLYALLFLVRNSPTAAKSKRFPFHCSWLLSIQPLVRAIRMSLEVYVIIQAKKHKIPSPLGWLGLFLTNAIGVSFHLQIRSLHEMPLSGIINPQHCMEFA